jgi:hypothetical protein
MTNVTVAVKPFQMQTLRIKHDDINLLVVLFGQEVGFGIEDNTWNRKHSFPLKDMFSGKLFVM